MGAGTSTVVCACKDDCRTPEARSAAQPEWAPGDGVGQSEKEEEAVLVRASQVLAPEGVEEDAADKVAVDKLAVPEKPRSRGAPPSVTATTTDEELAETTMGSEMTFSASCREQSSLTLPREPSLTTPQPQTPLALRLPPVLSANSLLDPPAPLLLPTDGVLPTPGAAPQETGAIVWNQRQDFSSDMSGEGTGFRSSSIAPLSSMLTSAGLQDLRPAVRAEFVILLDKDAGPTQMLGLDTIGRVTQGLGCAIRVEKIRPGLVANWNARHPDCPVLEGDHIIEVNGLSGDAEYLYTHIANSRRLELKIARRWP